MDGSILKALVVAAHPDDEVLGAGIWIHRHSAASVHILHITDGSPRDLRKAHSLGFPTRRSYAAARRRELASALRVLSVPRKNCIQLGIVDKEAYLNLPALIREVEDVIARLSPALVLSPAYEGGHPDHDSAALAVAVVHERRRTFEHLEFPLYHADRTGRMITGEFVRAKTSAPETVISFSRREQALKSQMIACFKTQQDFIRQFKSKRERLRPARTCDFTKAPHSGPLLYERWGWGITGAEWRDRALESLLI